MSRRKGSIRKVRGTQIPRALRKLFTSKLGIDLDVGCGEAKQKNFVGMDIRKVKGVDVIHSAEVFPWPFPSACCNKILLSHMWEHIKPWLTIKFMNECWRVMKEDGQLLISTPYAGSFGYWQDPTHCLTDGAEVLTKDGFKKIQDIKCGENILTFNMKEEKTEYAKCVNVINEDYTGEVLRFKHQRMNIVVVPNHDMLWNTRTKKGLWRKGRADSFENISPYSREGIGAIKDWKGKESEYIIIKGKKFIAEDFMEFLGWVLSEGCFIKKGNYKRILIHQSRIKNPTSYNRIDSLLNRMDLKHGCYRNRMDVKSDILFDLLKITGKSEDRYIPTQFKMCGVRLLKYLLEGLLLGDGEKNANGGGYGYTTISERLAKDVNEIAVKCGLRSAIRTREIKKFKSPNGKTYNRKKQFRVSITYDRPLLYPKPKREQYKGKIVSVTVDKNKVVLFRQNGYVFWSGNCNPAVEATWTYFDPAYPLYGIYKPKPWKITRNAYQMNHNIEVIMEKRVTSKVTKKEAEKARGGK